MLRRVELHVVMYVLRALGSSFENSGIYASWIESSVYGSATTRHILKCTYYTHSLRAHIYSYMALYELSTETFLKRKSQPGRDVPGRIVQDGRCLLTREQEHQVCLRTAGK